MHKRRQQIVALIIFLFLFTPAVPSLQGYGHSEEFKLARLSRKSFVKRHGIRPHRNPRRFKAHRDKLLERFDKKRGLRGKLNRRFNRRRDRARTRR